MARDLIPPSSPAGRPAPDGTPNLIELPPEPERSPAQPAMREPIGPSQFRNRFGFLLGALAGVLVAAVVVGAVVVTGGERDAVAGSAMAPNWSAWKPTDSSLIGGSTQIAKKVSANYQHPNGKALALVEAGPLDKVVAVRGASGTVDLFDHPGVVYQFDGLGPNSSIFEGEGSEARFELIRREALELALYTFRYLPQAEQVLAILPPPPPTREQIAARAEAKAAAEYADAAMQRAMDSGKPEDVVAAEAAIAKRDKVSTTSVPDEHRRAIFYRPGDLALQLQTPLDVTLASKPVTATTVPAAELSRIKSLTLGNLFKWSIPDPARPILVLDR